MLNTLKVDLACLSTMQGGTSETSSLYTLSLTRNKFGCNEQFWSVRTNWVIEFY